MGSRISNKKVRVCGQPFRLKTKSVSVVVGCFTTVILGISTVDRN